MTPTELSARLAELQREEWHKEPGGLDGGQNDRALARLAEEIVTAERAAYVAMAPFVVGALELVRNLAARDCDRRARTCRTIEAYEGRPVERCPPCRARRILKP